MNTMKKLTLLNLKRNRVRTIVTVIGIILSTALMTVVTGVVSSGRQSLLNTEISNSGDWTIALEGKFNEHTANDLSQHRDVEYVYENAPVGVAGFDSKSSYKPFVSLTGMSKNSFENCNRCELAEGHYPQSADEILLTPQFIKYSQKTYHTGDKITLDVGSRWVKNTVDKNNIPEFGSEKQVENNLGDYSDYDPEKEDFITEFTKTYTVSGILKTANGDLESDSSSSSVKLFTGLSYDKSDRSAVYANTATMKLRLFDGKEADYIRVLSELTGLTEKQTQEWFNSPYEDRDGIDLSQNSFGITSFTYNYSVLRFRIFAVSEQTMQILYGIAITVLIIIILSSVFIIRNSFAISITEKTRLYGMLSSVGATPKQIRRNVLFEGFVLGAAGIPLGIGLGIGVTALLTMICNTLLKDGLNGNDIVFCVSWLGIAVAVVLSVLTIFFSTIFTAVRASKISPVDAIRGNKDVKISNTKSYKTPKFIERLFGIGGSIAYKNLKRSRKKYRATVVSIVASVALFISVFSLVTYTFSYVGSYTEPLNYNMNLYPTGSENTYKDAEACYNAAKRQEDIERLTEYVRYYGSQMKINKADISAEMFQPDVNTTLFGNSNDWLDYKRVTCMIPQVMALDDNSYREICKECGIDYEYAKDKGIICNENSSTDSEGKAVVTGKLLKNPKDTEVELLFTVSNDDSNVKENNIKLKLAGELKRSEALEKFSETGLLSEGNVLVSLDWMKENLPDDIYPVSSDIYIQSSDPDKAEQELSDILGGSVWVQNYDFQARMINGVTLVIEIFVYGFIIAISLIGVTNIFNTISTNMRLRAREFASLRSIGMTRREFNRMISLESVFYSVKSLLFGIPIGLLGGWIIKLIYSQRQPLEYQFPWLAILISIAAVGLAVWMIMRYSIAKVRKQNIIETIRNENI